MQARCCGIVQVVLITDAAIATDLMRDKSLDKSTRGYSILNAVREMLAALQRLLEHPRLHARFCASLQLFTDKGHLGLLTNQMNAQWKAVRRAVASALSPQSLRCCSTLQAICASLHRSVLAQFVLC